MYPEEGVDVNITSTTLPYECVGDEINSAYSDPKTQCWSHKFTFASIFTQYFELDMILERDGSNLAQVLIYFVIK